MSRQNVNRKEYEKRVNRVMDYIRENRAGDLSLEILAKVAAFSPYHFHRVFKSIAGETLNEFIQRIRLEGAASRLISKPDTDILEIALDHGFTSASSFARAFRENFGMSATEWRDGGSEKWSKERKQNSNLSQLDRKLGKVAPGGLGHTPSMPRNFAGQEMEDGMKVQVKNLPGYHVAYMRNVGPYGASGGIPQLWEKLVRWAMAHDLWTADRVTLGISHDDPRVTEPAKCRYDAGIVVPSSFKADKQVNIVDITPGKYATTEFIGTSREIEKAWDDFFAAWLPSSGYEPDDRHCFELYNADGEKVKGSPGAFKCALCMPVKPI